MGKDWTDKMTVAEYNKLCDYCRENGYKEHYKGFKMHDKGYEYDKGLFDFIKHITKPYTYPMIDIKVTCCGSNFENRIPFRWVQVELRWYDYRKTGMSNIVNVQKYVSTLDEFIEFTNKITELEKLAKEFKI